MLKVSKSYSWNPDVIQWLREKAARETVRRGTGKSVSASEIANEILEKAMVRDQAAAAKEQNKEAK